VDGYRIAVAEINCSNDGLFLRESLRPLRADDCLGVTASEPPGRLEERCLASGLWWLRLFGHLDFGPCYFVDSYCAVPLGTPVWPVPTRIN
jgi:hypothetical protein